MMNRPLKVLISAYACGPNWGSEIGMGWGWVVSLSEHCELVVITESGFREDIEEKFNTLNVKYKPEFHYIDVGEKARKLFWKQNSFVFYYYYRIWQKKAFELASRLMPENEFDLVHQLNMTGYREPGFLWKIQNVPYLWGPAGGVKQVPLGSIAGMPIKSAAFYFIKSFINTLQFHLLPRPHKAAERSEIVLASTPESAVALRKKTKSPVVVLIEMGCHLPAHPVVLKERDRTTLHLVWVGIIQGRKALPIALKVLANLKQLIPVHLTVIGDGPDAAKCKELSKKLNIDESVTWLGKIPNADAIQQLQNADVFFLTSLLEGTPFVVVEALQNGKPVVCHNSFGHGAVVDDRCGIKIEQKNEAYSVTHFTKALLSLYNEPDKLHQLSKGALERSKELSWSSRAKEMLGRYHEVIEHYEKAHPGERKKDLSRH